MQSYFKPSLIVLLHNLPGHYDDDCACPTSPNGPATFLARRSFRRSRFDATVILAQPFLRDGRFGAIAVWAHFEEHLKHVKVFQL